MWKVRLVHITQDAEKLIAYCARASNPKSQEKGENVEKLLRYLIRHQHWSPFEMVSMCVEIHTTRAISAQMLRHKSFSFQEFSQRYAEVPGVETVEARRQDDTNRQGSVDELPESTKQLWDDIQRQHIADTMQKYRAALSVGIAKECARMLLPQASKTCLYMHGTIRSWIHYLQVRMKHDTQLEHRRIAWAVRDILAAEVPTVITACQPGEEEDHD